MKETSRIVRNLLDQIEDMSDEDLLELKKFIDLVLDVKPTQVTLVPDSIDQITSNAGWDTKIQEKK